MDLEILSLLKTPLKESIQEPTEDLIAYKTFGALANNALTLKITLLCADWVSSFFEFSATDRFALIGNFPLNPFTDVLRKIHMLPLFSGVVLR